MITVYNNIENFDLSAFGGPTNGTLVDCLIQEIDIATGNLLFNWRWVLRVSCIMNEVPTELWTVQHV